MIRISPLMPPSRLRFSVIKRCYCPRSRSAKETVLLRFRALFATSLLAVLAAALVACGGGSSGGGGEDPNKVLDQTFSQAHAKVTSGDLDLKFNLDVKGSQSG